MCCLPHPGVERYRQHHVDHVQHEAMREPSITHSGVMNCRQHRVYHLHLMQHVTMHGAANACLDTTSGLSTHRGVMWCRQRHVEHVQGVTIQGPQIPRLRLRMGGLPPLECAGGGGAPYLQCHLSQVSKTLNPESQPPWSVMPPAKTATQAGKTDCPTV